VRLFWALTDKAELCKRKGDAMGYVTAHNQAFSFVLGWRVSKGYGVFDEKYTEKPVIEMLIEVQDGIFVSEAKAGLYELASDGSGRTNKEVMQQTEMLLKEKAAQSVEAAKKLRESWDAMGIN
jgi:hypothetical protein